MNRIDVFLQYYRPHVSGLTNMAAYIAEYAAANGLDIHVHSVSLSDDTKTTMNNGVTVHHYKKSFSLGRGIFSLALIKQMWQMRKAGGVAHVHMPYPESFILAALFNRRWSFISTYQCDAPKDSVGDRLIATALDWSHKLLLRRSEITVASSEDYVAHSRLRKVLSRSGAEIVPVMGDDRAGGSARYRIADKRLIGFMGRPTYEKGINVLIGAMEKMPHADVDLLFAGPVAGLTDTVGYDQKRFQALVDSGRVHHVGFLEEGDIKDFYASLDLYVHPSINSFEAFGIVQIEAMSAGIPVVASDIPGVRTAVQETCFGEITKAGDEKDLLRGLLQALESQYDARRAREVLEKKYLPPVPHEQYLEFYRRTLEQQLL